MDELGKDYEDFCDDLNKEAKMDLIDHNYHEQEDLKCCRNCGQHDVAKHRIDNVEIEYTVCTVYGDPVADTAICDLFEF